MSKMVKEAEVALFKKWMVRTMRNIAKRYAEICDGRDHMYLTMSVIKCEDGIHLSFNNEFWDKNEDVPRGKDADMPINEWESIQIINGKCKRVMQ